MTYFRIEVHGFRCDCRTCEAEEREEVSEEPEEEGNPIEAENRMVEDLKRQGWTWNEKTDKHYCPECSKPEHEIVSLGARG